VESPFSDIGDIGAKIAHKASEVIVSKYEVLVLATHGLVPGELSGLTQPGLALSAPDVAGVEGNGLLIIGRNPLSSPRLSR
jgi:hypothetical protein